MGNGEKDNEQPNGGGGEDLPKIQPIRKPLNLTALAVTGLFLLAVFFTLYAARGFLLPVMLAWLLSMLLKPAVKGMKRANIPEPLGAAVLLIGVMAVIVSGFILLSEPAANWLKKAPESLEKVEGKIRSIQNSAVPLSKAAETVQKMTEKENETPKVELKRPGLLNAAWTQAKGVLVMGAEVFVLLFFLLATGDAFTLKLIQILPGLKDKKRALEIARETEKSISQYLVGMTIVNLIEGTAIETGLALIGMPNPLLWGVLAFAANYIPYLGAMIAGSIVTIVALVSFHSVGHALLAPLIYFGVNFTDNFLSPYVLGRRLVLNPLIVFLAVMFWGWLWGIAGVLLGVPITMALKIFCENNATLAPFSEFLTAQRSKRTPKRKKKLECQRNC